jgi:hypothetical protein
MSLFPHGRRDHLAGPVTQATSHVRSAGLAQTDEEARAEEIDRVTHRQRIDPLHPV